MRLYQIRVEIYEAATSYEIPIVVHLFHGRTKAEAFRYHEAHRSSDAFMKRCEDEACFAGNVPCMAVISEGWISGT
jgi:hypothetical protein